MANISAWWRITVCVWTHTYTETWWKLMELPVLKGSSLVMQTRYVISTKIQAIVLWAKPYYSSPTALIYRTLTHLTQNECARERKRAEEYWIAVVLLRALLWLNIIEFVFAMHGSRASDSQEWRHDSCFPQNVHFSICLNTRSLLRSLNCDFLSN